MVNSKKNRKGYQSTYDKNKKKPKTQKFNANYPILKLNSLSSN